MKIGFISRLNNSHLHFNLEKTRKLNKPTFTNLKKDENKTQEFNSMYKKAKKAGVKDVMLGEYLDLERISQTVDFETIKEVMKICTDASKKGLKINALMINSILSQEEIEIDKVKELLRVYKIAESDGDKYFPSEFSEKLLQSDIDLASITDFQGFNRALDNAGLTTSKVYRADDNSYMLTKIHKK